MDASDVVDLLSSLLKEYSPSGREAGVAEHLRLWLSSCGSFDRVFIDEVGNVIALKGLGPYVLLCSHMDTVPGRIKVKRDDKELAGRGAVDAKSALAAMAMASSEAVLGGAENVMFAAVVREEADGLGMQHVLSRGYKFRGAIFGEPTDTKKIAVGYRGRIGVMIRFQGKASHASTPSLGRNAVEECMKHVLMLKAQLDNLGCTASITQVRGGLADNVIPSNCWTTIDIRVPVNVSLEAVRTAVSRMTKEGVNLSFTEQIPPISVGRSNEAYTAIAAALKSGGMVPRAVNKMGTSDMNQFYFRTGVPCVAYGPGDAALAHTDAEVVLVNDVKQAAEVYRAALERMCACRKSKDI
jgi:LysW-gamma-L-lysine carboxypeptidase